MTAFLLGGWRTAWRDLIAALDAILDPRLNPVRLLIAPAVGLVVGWFLYVPVHELLHVLGCVATGGTVSRLTLDPLYGASLLAKIFPFVEPSTEYAGRLTGFSTRGSDLIYLATDAAPYAITVVIGVPLLRAIAAGRSARSGWKPWMFGPAVVLAAAPFLSLTGDFFEMATILVTAPFGPELQALRSDDLFRLIGEMSRLGIDVAPAVAYPIVAGCLGLSVLLVGWTYRLGVVWSVMVARRWFPADRGPDGPAS